jgi:Zn-dependent protease with chaperone function
MVDRRRRRRLDATTFTSLAPVVTILPFSVLALAVFWVPAHLVWGVRYWPFALGYLAAAVVLFVRPVQAVVLTPLLGARRPTREEAARLGPVWSDIARSNGLAPSVYVLRVLPSDELNAFACGGHLVVVTSFALESLKPRELSGVLAHELSHHLGLHTISLTLWHWLSLPVVLLARVGFVLQNVATAATDSFARHSRALTVGGGVIAGLLTAVSWVFLAALYAADAVNNAVGRSAEFEADRRVVRMGFGRELAAALRRVAAASRDHDRPTGWRARLASSHPPARTRIARIEAMLRHPAR